MFTTSPSERLYRVLTELTSDVSGVIGADGIWRWVSPGCRALLGFQPEELIGGHALDIVHPEEVQRLAERMRREVAGEGGDGPITSERITFRLAKKSGGWVWVEAAGTVVRDEGGGAVEFCFALRDVSARREAEEALRRSEARLRDLFEGATEALAVLRGGRVQFVNPALVALLGCDGPGDLLGRPLADLLVDGDRGALTARPGDHPSAGPWTNLRELRLVRKGGDVVTVEVALRPIEFDGAPAILASARDVTDRKRIQARLLEADRVLSIGTLAAGVAHEINNPLAAVIANLDVVAEDLPRLARGADPASLAELEDTLRDAREGATRVARIVRDLRMLAEPQDGHRGPTDVRRALDAAISMAWAQIRHRARLVKSYGDAPPAQASEAGLGRVFLNLLLNAAHAIPDGRADENEITVTTRREGARAIVEIRDSGCGIPSDLLGRIFDPFFTTRKMGEGAGLGLAICQSTVRALGGDITCDSVLGRGSTFRVTLPAADYEPVAGEVAALPAGERRGRILVIDDEPMIGASVRRTLASEHEVIALTAAREALDRIVAGERFDLILCDMMMPVMTGVDLYGELVERAPEQARRVVFFTGGAFTARAQRFLEEVPNPRIEKPFEPAALRSFVRACLA